MKENLIYAAGLIDGEGSIMLIKHHQNEFRSPSISVASTSYELLQFLKDSFGGCICQKRASQKHHKPSWHWALNGDRALGFIKDVLPYLKEEKKVSRAKLIVNKYKLLTIRNGKYNKDQIKLKLDFEKEFLNIK